MDIYQFAYSTPTPAFLFIDFSSAFNTINLINLFNKLLDMNIDPCRASRGRQAYLEAQLSDIKYLL